MSEQALFSDQCMDPVCMASTKDLIREIKKRYSTGSFVLLEPTPQTKEQYEEWCEENQSSGFVVWPERYHRQGNSWGHRHMLLGVIGRMFHEINIDTDKEERDIPEEEHF